MAIHLAYINGTENFYKYPDVVLGIRGLINIFDQCKEILRTLATSSSNCQPLKVR